MNAAVLPALRAGPAFGWRLAKTAGKSCRFAARLPFGAGW